MDITIKTIPHAQQRYAGTVGDWIWNPDGDLFMFISDVGDWRKEACVAYHELLEALECKAKGITQKQVDEFDKSWKEHDGLDEPGDDPAAPYYWQHQHAMVAERHLANCLDVNWVEYEQTLDAL